jgi:cell division protein FtsZ
MTSFPHDLKPKITVVGVGGAGGNAVNNMIRSKLEGVEFVVGNTDAQALEQSLVEPEKRIQLGLNITQGLGAGSKPDVGRAAAEESIEEITNHLIGSNMVFITAGMGGGTGTGAAPVIARAARENGILTVGVVSKPFNFEGKHRCKTADEGIEELQQYVDTLIVIPNQNLFRIATENTTFADAFKLADDVLYSGVRGVTDLMIMPGLINLDFADIRAVMAEMGKAMMGTGEAEGDRRALDAAEAAISNPLLDDVSMKGAKGVLINITGGYDMTLWEADEAANRIRDDVDSDANIIFGSTFDEKLNGRIRVSVVATGIGDSALKSNQNNKTLPNDSVTNNTSPRKNEPLPTSQFSAGFRQNTQNPSENSSDKSNNTQNHYQAPNTQKEVTNEPAQEQNPNTQEVPFTKNMADDLTSPQQSNENSETVHEIKETPQPIQKQEPVKEAYPQKKRTPSLFERFTSVGRSRSSQNESEVRITKAEDSEPKEKDNDDLEIPAFLRRESGQ